MVIGQNIHICLFLHKLVDYTLLCNKISSNIKLYNYKNVPNIGK